MITAHRRNLFHHDSCAPTPEQKDFITYWRPELEKLSTGQILCWAAEMFPSKLALVTSCGIGGGVLISMIGQIKLDIPVVNPGGGEPLGETRRLYDRLKKMFDVHIESGSSKIFRSEASLCCGGKRYGALRRAAEHFDLWISEARREHYPNECKRSVLDWDDRFGLLRISPLIRWTGESLRNKALKESIPFDELSDLDYFDDDCYACLMPDRYDRTNEKTIGAGTTCCCKS